MKTSINQNNQLIYSQFSGKDNLALGLEGLANIDFDWDWGNRTQNLSWRYIPNSNYIVTTRLSKTQYDFDVDFEIDFNPSTGTADTSTTDLSSGSTDLDLFLDNLVEDVDLNQNIKFIITDDISFDDRTDEDQIGATYPELEWAMRYSENNNNITAREKEVLAIYKSLREVNSHKMKEIPVCSIPEKLR